MEAPKEPHSVSLKVLRLSRPSFSDQTRLPEPAKDTNLSVNPNAPLDHDLHETNGFVFSPLLTLPPTFGSAYVGETFSCSLCANNELPDASGRRVFDVRMTAEMQTPTQTVPLDLTKAEAANDKSHLDVGESLQRIVRFDLQSEGNHVLAVSVTYSETTSHNEDHPRSRTRTFRKLYQFIAAPCLNVRTKVSQLPLQEHSDLKLAQMKPASFALEAQLENMADGPITLEKVAFSPKQSLISTSINWDASWSDIQQMDRPFLMPRDVTQVAFLIKQLSDEKQPKSQVETTKDGRMILGQLTVRWRTAMGDPGFLTTGWLTTRKRP
ncbi:MAG: hypothetical protein Q9209_003968 [Squamulea sp. 1 TL-2023]